MSGQRDFYRATQDDLVITEDGTGRTSHTMKILRSSRLKGDGVLHPTLGIAHSLTLTGRPNSEQSRIQVRDRLRDSP